MEQWGPTAVGGLFVAIIGALGTWWLKSRDKDIETRKLEAQNRLSELELQHRLKKEDNAEDRKLRKSLIEEKDEVIEKLHEDLKIQREEIQELRNECNSMRLRVELCEQERKYMSRQIAALMIACREANIKVAMPMDSTINQSGGPKTPPPQSPQPPTKEGNQ